MAEDVLDVEFFAPVPSGHTVYFAEVRSTADASLVAKLVLDRDARMLYCDAIVGGPLRRDPRAVENPLAVLQQFTWEVVQQRTATVLGAVIFQTGYGRQPHTRLFLGPDPTAPYR